jgi:hypothetical protein
MQARFTKKLWPVVEGIVLIVSLAITILTAVLFHYQRFTLTRAYRQQYEGKIVDKTMRFHESEEGSSRESYLVIEGKDGGRFLVSVREDAYNRARVGMWVRRDRGGFELFSAEPREGFPGVR